MDGIKHNEAWEGFGSSQLGDVQALLKALEAQEGVTDVANLIDVGALQPQSLEGTLALLTFQEKHLVLWKDIPKGMAQSTLEEYSVQLGYGMSSSGWVQQMESALEADASFAREYAIMKFQRQMWKFSDIAGIVRAITPVERAQKQAAALRCMRNMNRSLYSGDSDFVSESIDGFEKTIVNNGSTNHVIDLRGTDPTQQDFREGAELIVANYGSADGANLYLSPGAQTTLDQILDNNLRVNIGQGQAAGGKLSIGYGVNRINTSFGSLVPKVDIFLAGEYDGKTVPKIADPSNPRVLIEGATSDRAPATPSIAVTTQGATVANSQWSGAGVRQAANTYQYRVAAGNRFGMSAAVAAADAGGNVVAAGSNTIAITPAASAYPATYFEIYSEQVAGSGDFKYLGRIAASGLTPVDYVDLNEDIPGTGRMFLLDLSSIGELRTFMLSRLAPMHSKEYARIGEYRWGSVNLYGTPKYYAPLRFVMYKNMPIGVQSKSGRLEV